MTRFAAERELLMTAFAAGRPGGCKGRAGVCGRPQAGSFGACAARVGSSQDETSWSGAARAGEMPEDYRWCDPLSPTTIVVHLWAGRKGLFSLKS